MSGSQGFVSLLSVCRFRLDLWLAARSLPWRVSGKPLDQILAMASPEGRSDYPGLAAEYIARRVRKSVRRPLLMRDRRCLREGLLGFEFLSRAGYAPELHFAVEPASVAKDRIAAHCWVCLDGQPVVGDRLGDQVTIFVHRSPAQGMVH
ncbi:MAG: lasso peptide biosynthesis B2 protein [Hyphomicrobiales bacterium]|nr:lasso peptide biosynthesis B2 protein [Hyphomicrobiales bacterium]